MIKLSKTTIDELWWLIISIDYDYSRITIADFEMDDQHLTLWLEDKEDFKNTLNECLEIKITLKQFARVIKADKNSSYESAKMSPMKWYRDEATETEQQWAREEMLKALMTELVEGAVTA